MAENRNLTNPRQSLLGIVTAAVALLCLGIVLIHRGKALDWGSTDTILAVIAAVLAVVASAAFGGLLGGAVAAAGRERISPAAETGGLAGVLLGLGCLLLMLVGRVTGAPWGKTDTILLVLGLLGLVAGVIVWWGPLSRMLSARGTVLQMNAAVTLLLVVGIVVLLNYSIIPRRLGWIKADWTKEGYYSLSPQSVNVARSIKPDQPIELLGLAIKAQEGIQQFHILKERLQDYARQNGTALSYRMVDPNIDLDGRKLIQEAGVTTLPAVVIRYKNKPDQHETVNSTDEAEITRALMKLQNPSSRKLYFVTGHGELDADSTAQASGPLGGGMTLFPQVLKNDRYETAKLDLKTTATVPTDAAAVIAVSPQVAYAPLELQKLDAYLANGGRLLVFLDPLAKTNLGDVLVKYGIKWHPEVVNDSVMQQMGGDPRLFAANEIADHEVVKAIKVRRLPVAFFGTGYFTQDPSGSAYQVTDLMKSASSSYAAGPNGTKTNGPLTLAMLSATRDPEPPKDAKAATPPPATTRIRIAAFGTGAFVNDTILQGVVGGTANAEVAANTVAWLTDNTQAIGIRAKDPAKDQEARKITIDDKGRRWMLLLTLFLPLVLVIVAGVSVRLARR